MKKVLSVAILLLVCATTFAGGFRVSLQGNRALAMGHTGVAIVNNAELAFFNPGGLVYLENKLNVAVGGFGVSSDITFQNEEFAQAVQADSPVGTPAYLYASYGLSDSFALALAVYTPYGSRVEYPIDWVGSHLVNTIDLQAIYVQPLFSWKIIDEISIGGGPILAIGSVEFNRNLSRTLTDLEGNRSNVTVEDSGVTSFGFSAGAFFNISDQWAFGINYRSRITLEAENGDATFSNLPDSPLVGVTNGTIGFNAEIPLPAEWTIGLSYKPSEKWLLALDYVIDEWSAYENLDIDFIPEGVPDSFNPRNYRDAIIVRFGAQYTLNNSLTLRGGYYFDETPIRDGFFSPETPRNNSHGITAGLSFNINERIAIDASFLYLYFPEVDASFDFFEENGQFVPFGGTFQSNAFSGGIGVSYNL